MPVTADGYPIKVGDTIWVRSSIIDPKIHPTEHIVGKITNEHKLEYAEVDIENYIGAKITACFHLKENAYWKEGHRE